MTVQGCRKLCGEGPHYYFWPDVSSTITTWVRFLLHLVQSTANVDYCGRYCQLSDLLYRLPLKATRTSEASWRLRDGSAILVLVLRISSGI